MTGAASDRAVDADEGNIHAQGQSAGDRIRLLGGIDEERGAARCGPIDGGLEGGLVGFSGVGGGNAEFQNAFVKRVRRWRRTGWSFRGRERKCGANQHQNEEDDKNKAWRNRFHGAPRVSKLGKQASMRSWIWNALFRFRRDLNRRLTRPPYPEMKLP